MWTVWPRVTFVESTVTSCAPSATAFVGVAPTGACCDGLGAVPDVAPAPEGVALAAGVCDGKVFVPDDADPVWEEGWAEG